MKKFLAILLTLAMAFSLVACGGNGGNNAGNNAGNSTSGNTANDTGDAADNTANDAADAGDADSAETVTSADDIPDSMTSEDGKYQVAFVTDVGQLKDKSFNQGTWNGVKLYADANDMSYKYYQPANGDQATDDDRYDAMKAAVDAGATAVVCAGYLQEAALQRAAIDFPDVQFIFIDGYPWMTIPIPTCRATS